MKKRNKMRLPKRLMGVKLPKEARRGVNGLLKSLPPSAAKPIIVAAVSGIALVLAEKLEHPLRTLIESANDRASRKRPARRRSERLPSVATH